jgi:hypothetical protein
MLENYISLESLYLLFNFIAVNYNCIFITLVQSLASTQFCGSVYSNKVLLKRSLCCTTEYDRNENGHLLKLYSHCIFITPWCKIHFSHFIHLDPYFPWINFIFI